MNAQERKQALKQRVDAMANPYTAALLASGVNILSLEMIPEQALTAGALRKGPASKITADLALDIGPEFAVSLTRWLDGKDHSVASWNRLLERNLQVPFETLVSGKFAAGMKKRGLTPAGQDVATNSVRKALLNTNDIRLRLLNPERMRANSTPNHTIEIVRSLAKSSEDVFLRASVAGDPKLTGRRKWISPSGKDSRHKHLHNTISEKGETFQVGGQKWYGPRSQPHVVSEASGCTCYTLFETTKGRWI